MRSRCSNPRLAGFKNYGGRGISLCVEWNDFATFETWAKLNGYKPTLSIERSDVDLGYSPGNCTWATAKEQNINRRFVKRAEDGRPWFEVALANGIPRTLFHSRVHDGWPIEAAATLPKHTRWKRQT